MNSTLLTGAETAAARLPLCRQARWNSDTQVPGVDR
jgi:hypothetical protein